MHRFFFLQKAIEKPSAKIGKAGWSCFLPSAFSGRSTEGCNPFVLGTGVRVTGGDLCGNTAKAPTDAKRRRAHWRVEGSQPHRVKGETPCPGKVDACVNLYWVLPDAKFAGFAASPPLPGPAASSQEGGNLFETDTTQWTLRQAWHL